MVDATSFKVVAYEKEYFPQIIEMWREQFDQGEIEKRKRIFDWLTGQNPYKNGHPAYFVMMADQKVIGMHGHMPLLFHISGEEQLYCMAHDDLLSQEYRGKGLGKIILKGTAEIAESLAGALWFNEANFRLYSKSGWLEVPDLRSYVKIYEPGSFLKQRIKNSSVRKVVSGTLKRLLQIQRSVAVAGKEDGVRVVEIDGFDEAFDRLSRRVASRYGIMVVRDSRYLNWKYVEKPFSRYKRYAASAGGGELSGYMVTKVENDAELVKGRIIDFLYHPDEPEVFAGLLSRCCEELEKKGVEYIETVTSSPLIAKQLRRVGFLKARKPVRFMVKNWERILAKEYVGSIANWYITPGDGDGDSWTVDAE